MSEAIEVRVTPPPALNVVVREDLNPPHVEVLVGDPVPHVVEVRVPGPAGPPGPPGGGGGDAHLTHTQSAPATVWLVEHGLGKHPSVSVVDSAGTEVVGDVEYLGPNALTITHAFPFSGVVYCN